ncbi:carbohydrate ABC transporter permease [Streptomyces sp. L7]
MTLVKDSVPTTRKARSAAPVTKGRRGRRENLAGYLFMSPWIAGFLLLTAGPMAASLYFAFTDYNLFNSPKWVGFDNFTAMFDDPRWRKSVEVTAKYGSSSAPC